MELGLSLGEMNHNTTASRPSFTNKMNNKGLGFCMSLGLATTTQEQVRNEDREVAVEEEDEEVERVEKRVSPAASNDLSHQPLQLDLLPLAPVPRTSLPWLSENGNSEAGSPGQLGATVRGFDVNRFPSTTEEVVDDGAAVSSPNSTVSSFQIDFSIYRNKRDSETAGLNDAEAERTSSRGPSDDDENGSTRKKLRLSKEQSAFLEESFKEHNTLNPKQKLALAKQLNLRPRQVEVWFQNRRARTKLKQTEVDCEYLKRCCDTLTEENRRLQKEIQELRALKTSHPYYMQLPATTLTMCPSCERVATTTSTAPTTNTTTTITTATTTATPTPTTTNNSAENCTTTTINTPIVSAFSLTKPRFYPFSHAAPS